MTAACRWSLPRSRPTWAGPRPAIDRVKSMLKGKPEDREVYIALAQMYSRMKDWDEAEQNIDKADRTFHQAGGQGIRDLRRRLDVRAAEEVRQGGRSLP